MTALNGKLKRMFQDYKINLINMRFIPEYELERMESDLKYVLGLMKCAGSRKKYEQYIMAHSEYFSRLPRSAADVLDVCVNIHDVRKYLVYQEGESEEEADMCKALEDIKKDAMKQGKRIGKEQGKRIGKEQGKRIGEERGMDRVNKLIQLLFRDGRHEDLRRSATDTVFQKKLLAEYHI